MSDPRRWLEHDDLDPEIAALLRSARPPRSMTAAERARTARRVARLCAVPAGIGALAFLKSVAYAAAIGATAGAGLAGARLLVDDAPAPAAPEEPAETAPPFPAPPPPREAAEPAPADTIRAAPPGPAPAPLGSADDIAAEAALLEQARRALVADPQGALDALAEHGRRFPAGKLGVEREVMIVEALARSGRMGEARARAERLLSRSPGHLYEERLRAVLEP
jgi:hypothetical protein